MSKNLLNCAIKDWESDDPTQQFDPNTPSNVTKHIADLHQRWKAVNPTASSTKANKIGTSQFFEHLNTIGNIAGAATYDPDFYVRMVNRMTYGLGKRIERGVARIGGNVNDYFHRLDRQGRGFIWRQIADGEIANKAKDLAREVNNVVKAKGLTDIDRATLSFDLTRLSSHPYLIQYSGGAGAAAQNFLVREQDRIMKRLQGMGLSMDDIKSLTKYSDIVVQTEFEMAHVATQIDIDPQLLLNGSMNRLLTPQAQRVLRMMDNAGKEVPEVTSFAKSPAKWIKDSRNTSVFLPSDAETLDFLFRNSSVYDRIANKHGIDKAAITFDGLMMHGNDDIISDMLLNELTDKELDFLTATGLLNKIPLDTTTLYEQLNKRYQLPFEGLNEMFLYNPEKAVAAYTGQLEELAAESSQLWGLIRGAEDGFGVPKSIIDQDPKGYQTFVPLYNALPGRLKRRITDETIVERLKDLHVNPQIAKFYKTSQEVFTNPTKLGILGDVLQTTRRISQGMLLGTLQWFTRNFVSDAITLEMMGINLQNHAGHFTKMLGGQLDAVRRGKVFDYSKMLSDKPTLYGGKSVRELYKKGISKGLISDWSVLGRASKGSFEDTNWKTLKQLLFIKNNYPEQLPQELLQSGIRGINNAYNSTLYKYLAYGNAITDNAAKLAMAEQLMNPNRIIRKVGGEGIDALPVIKDMDNAWDYVQKHWYNFDDAPRDSMWFDAASSAMPFFTFYLKNFQHTGRLLMEHPNRFGSFLKLAQRHKEEYKRQHPVEDYAKRTDWSLDEMMDYPFVIPAEYSGTGKDEHFDYSLGTLIASFGAYDSAVELLDFFGAFNDNRTPAERKDNPYSGETDGKLRALLDNSRVSLAQPVQAIVEMAARLEESYKENNDKKRTLFGIKMSGTTYGAITSLLHPLRPLDRLFQYTPLAGRAPDTNEVTGEFTPGKRSVFGDVPTRPTRGQQPKALDDISTAVLDVLGLAPNYVDSMYNTYRKIGDLSYMISQSRRELKQYPYKLAKATDEEQVKQLKDQYREHWKWSYMITVQWEIIQKWRKDSGLTSKQALDQIRRANLRIDELLPEDEQRRIAADNWAKYQTDYNMTYEEPTLRP